MNEAGRAIGGYAAALENLSKDTLPALQELCAPDMEFRDPWHHTHSSRDFTRILAAMFRSIRNVTFQISDIEGKGNQRVLSWRFTGQSPWLGKLTIEGTALVECNNEGRITRHIEQWSPREQIWQRLPVIGALLRKLPF